MSDDGWHYNHVILLRVVDGDTVECIIDYGFTLKQIHMVRLARINAPELNKAGGQDAKKHLENLLISKNIKFTTYKPKDKYGRYLADVYADNLYINQAMIDDGHATAYEGSGL